MHHNEAARLQGQCVEYDLRVSIWRMFYCWACSLRWVCGARTNRVQAAQSALRTRDHSRAYQGLLVGGS